MSEISVQLVTDKYGTLIGRMASINKLNNGIPIEILPIDNSEVWKTIDKLFPILQEYGLKGPINIQGRLTDDGFKIFEMKSYLIAILIICLINNFQIYSQVNELFKKYSKFSTILGQVEGKAEYC